jgi:uncharacterized protein YndB with AHSA1/START domain
MSDRDDGGAGARRHVGPVVRKEISIDATPEEVWEAWAEPEGIARWFVDRAEGRMEAGATVTWIFETFGYRLPIEVYEAVRGRTLVFGGEPPGRPQALQEVHVRQAGGSTLLRLANSGFYEEDEEGVAGVDSGWDMALATLRHQLERYPGRRRVHHFVMRPARFEYEDAVPLFTTAEGLGRWLAPGVEVSPAPAEAGSRVRVPASDELPGGLRGEVLARTPWEVLLSWPEQGGVLGLKAFKMGEDRAVALDFSAWPEGGPENAAEAGVGEELRAALDRAVAKLAAAVTS